jgi:hypothetical protein
VTKRPKVFRPVLADFLKGLFVEMHDGMMVVLIRQIGQEDLVALVVKPMVSPDVPLERAGARLKAGHKTPIVDQKKLATSVIC